MNTLLYRFGRTMVAHPWYAGIGWLVTIGVLAWAALTFYQPPSPAISIPGTQAQQALDRMAELFPDAGKGSARIALEATSGTTIVDHQASVQALVEEVSAVEGVKRVIGPDQNPAAVSEDGTIAYVSVQLREDSGEVTAATREGVMAAVDGARETNLVVEAGGDVIDKMPGEILGVGEVLGVVLALAVLVVTLGSLVAAGLPIIVALVSIAVGTAGLFGLSQVVDISSTTPVLGIMLGLAVGIDYSLFIISKYRHFLLSGYGYPEAVARSIATAGKAVLFAAATVVIALSALTIVQIPFMSTMGLAGAATVAVTALVAVSLLPAILGLVGRRIFGGKTRQRIEAAQKRGPKESHRVNHGTKWYHLAEWIRRHKIAVIIGSVLVIGVIALPTLSLKLGLPTDEYAATDTSQRKTYDILERGFGAGFNAPLLVVAEGIPPVTEAEAQAVRTQLETAFDQEVASQTAAKTAEFQARLAAASSPEDVAAIQSDMATAQAEADQALAAGRATLEAQIAQYIPLYHLKQVADAIAKLDGVAVAQPAMVTDDTTAGLIQVIPTAGPSDPTTLQLIATLRDEATVETVTGSSEAQFGVTGATALESDVNEKLAAALPLYLLVVVGLSLLLLIVVFRSLLIPLKATLGFLLSVGAMFGAMVAVFQWGWFGIADAPGPLVSFIPIIAIGVLFGLAMDYEFFLVSSMQEEYERTYKAERAVVDGYALGSKVVVAAGVIMVAVFAGFITNHDATIQAIGLGLAVGILVDAFIVRLLLTPAIMSLLGKSAWWLPAWLERVLPRVSIEGEAKPAKKHVR